MTSLPDERFPDLAGKAVIVVASDELLVELTRRLATNRMMVAVVGAVRDHVQRAVAAAEQQNATVNGFTVDPADPAVWERIRPHIEQRLGPIDVVICTGSARQRATVVAALVPDMSARRRGALIEVGDAEARELRDGVHHYSIDPDLGDEEIASRALRYASDTSR